MSPETEAALIDVLTRIRALLEDDPKAQPGDPSAWPIRMTRDDVRSVLRISKKVLQTRIAQGRFPKPDDGRTWHRDVVRRYCDGQIKEFEKAGQRLRMVSR